ncbi:MAG TPA: ABC transporter ATP-binding protein/permease [Stellaceae bacterium]|nr:ABC transporter ATP-binding protein/permease [Stellaceae bacterium]
MSEKKRSSLRDAWRLVKPYWASDEKWWAWGLLVLVTAQNLFSVYLTVRFNYWYNDFYNALQQYDWHAFFRQALIFCGLATVYVVNGVYMVYFQQMLQIRWRRWLTRRFIGAWLDERAYYTLSLKSGGTDNPDQRIADDLSQFTSSTLDLFIGGAGILNSVVTFFSFLAILWTLSGSLTVPLGVWGNIALPGYLLWFAVIYAIAGTWLTFKVGRPLIGLNFQQQRYEADFRFSLVRLRENVESVAFYGGERRERENFLQIFSRVFDNFWQIMRRTKRLGWYQIGYAQAAVIVPVFLAAPRYFTEHMEFGWLRQTLDAFGQIQSSLSFIVQNYNSIATWQAVVQRLSTFEERVNEIADSARGPRPLDIRREGGGLAVAGLDLHLPDGAPLLHNVSFAMPPGASQLIVAPTGTGKSTLLRALAGIWPFARGNVRLDQGRSLFLPQRPYLPLGSLGGALTYPREHAELPRERLEAVLRQVGLGAFVGELDTVDNWAQRLSLGEQQRLAFARVLLSEPAIVFLDEATSALDEEAEAQLYQLLRKAPWRPTVVSVGHRSTLRAFHDSVLPLTAAAGKVAAAG